MALTFQFQIHDEHGLWGSICVSAEDEPSAQLRARELLKNEIEPKGSLLPGFTLVKTHVYEISTP